MNFINVQFCFLLSRLSIEKSYTLSFWLYSKANYTKIISAWFSSRFFITIVPWLLNLLVFFMIREQPSRSKFNNYAEYFSIYAQEATTRDYFHFILLQSLYLCSRSLVRILKLLTFFKPPINHCQPNFNPKNSTWIIFDTSEAFLKKKRKLRVAESIIEISHFDASSDFSFSLSPSPSPIPFTTDC